MWKKYPDCKSPSSKYDYFMWGSMHKNKEFERKDSTESLHVKPNTCLREDIVIYFDWKMLVISSFFALVSFIFVDGFSRCFFFIFHEDPLLQLICDTSRAWKSVCFSWRCKCFIFVYNVYLRVWICVSKWTAAFGRSWYYDEYLEDRIFMTFFSHKYAILSS